MLPETDSFSCPKVKSWQLKICPTFVSPLPFSRFLKMIMWTQTWSLKVQSSCNPLFFTWLLSRPINPCPKENPPLRTPDLAVGLEVCLLIQRSMCVSSLKDLTDSDPESSTAERLGTGAASGFKWKSSVGEIPPHFPPKPCLPCSSSPLTLHFGFSLIRHHWETCTLFPFQLICSFLFLTTES